MTEHMGDEPRDKRQAILLAARGLFADQGYEETTIAMIARSARVAVGTVYLYFQSKHDILVDVCLDLNADIAAVLRSPHLLALPLRQMPRAIIAAIFRTSREKMRFMPYAQVAAQSSAEVVRLRASKQAIADSLEDFFRQAVAHGHLAPFDTAVYAVLLSDLMSATLHQCFVIEQGEREEMYREGVINLIERLFFGPPIVAGERERAEISAGER